MRLNQVYLLFDERMALHKPVASCEHTYPDEETDTVPFENSSRIIHIHKRMLELEARLMLEKHVRIHQLWPRRRFVSLDPDPCDRATIELAHTPNHYDFMKRTAQFSDDQLRSITNEGDLYFCRDTFLAASLACGGVVTCVDAVMESFSTGVGPTRAIALVRPPGHHATKDKAMGFCYFNNIAVAAKHAIHSKQAERVFILDYDIHHGNGIQDITYDDPNIFYLSIHRASFARNAEENDYFYPGTGRHSETGKGQGTGTNLNIVWPKAGMGNTEYAAAFSEIVLPVLSAFNPDLIIIACGLDAAKGDLLGDCGLSPDMFYIMTKSLLETAGEDIPFVVALEGGYHLETIASCMEAVALSLFDEPWSEVRDDFDSDTRASCNSKMWGRREHALILRSNQEFNLARYWNRQAFYDRKKKKMSTKIAMSAIRKSAKALARKGTFIGSIDFMANPGVKRVRLSNSMGLSNIITASVPDYRFCAAAKVDPLLPRNHRPCQNIEHLPLKKRKLMVEMEAASKLLACTHG